LAKKFPITTTSANISNNEILSNPIEIANELNGSKSDNDSDLIDIVIDTGSISSNNPSTIVDLSNGLNNYKIIRQGTGKFSL
ncbi:MAG: L-threonylcarbamoyladenylate synthase, partial [Methanobacteriaceae archaeon]